MSAASKRKSLGGNRDFDSLQNLVTIIPHPLAFSTQNGARDEIFRIALTALTPDEFVEWLNGFGCGEANRGEAA